jgi:capsular polysaccharide biosynthesis protein
VEEFVPVDYFVRLMKNWWLIAVTTIIGGVVGFLFHLARPPIYEATVTFFVNIDYAQIADLELEEYDKDLALSVTREVMVSSEVLDGVIDRINELGLGIEPPDFLKSLSFERKHAFWELRFRHTDPRTAQTVVNIWADLGYETMRNWQENGKVASYITFNSPNFAVEPDRPVIFARRQLLLAGGVLGLVGGIFLSELLSRSRSKP